MTDTSPPKRSPGRPRVHATPEAAREAARARANAHTRARRAKTIEKTVALDDATVARGDEVIGKRGLDGWSHLVRVLLEDEQRRLDGDL